jgi:hypothetical protein
MTNKFDYSGLWLTLIELGILTAGTIIAIKSDNMYYFGTTLFAMTVIWLFS